MPLSGLTTLFHALLMATILAGSHATLKWVAEREYDNYWQLLLNEWKAVLLALSAYGFIFFYYVFVLRGAAVSLLYPVYTGLSVLFVVILGRWMFGETVGATQWLGAALLLAGIVLISSNR